MSNPQTFYTVGGIDLSGIFQPLSLGTQYANATGYAVNGYGDLNQIFASNVGPTIGYNTGYKYNGNDLSTIFAPYDPTFTLSITNQNQYITVSNFIQSGYSVYQFETANPGDSFSVDYTTGTCNISFSANRSINFILVGGGGGGGYSTGGSAGGGGGGGDNSIVTGETVLANTNYILQVGSGGVKFVNASQNGENSVFYGGALQIQGTGGFSGGNPPDSQSGGFGGSGGGNGGSGGITPTSGINGTIINTPYGDVISCGGGGGGGEDNTGPGGGGGGNNSFGGLVYTGTTLILNGTGYGAGGGGGATAGGSSTSSGGYGASGLVIIYWAN